MANLEWNVYYFNLNHKKIEVYNIFNHHRFKEDADKAFENANDFDEFSTQLRKEVMYYFWSKCEWEVELNDWLDHKDVKPLKIDVYDQVALNWDAFVSYVWKQYVRNLIGEWRIK